MSTYKEIKGFKVQTLSTDTAASQAATGTWASGGALTTGRNGLRGAGVSQTAVVVFGGNDGSTTGKTENYNGSSWSETTDLNTAKSNGLGVGTYTSALCTETGTNEKWNGSSWTELAELSTPRAEIGSFGTSTAALAIGNQNGSSGIVEQWNGSSWTEVGDLTTAMGSVCGFGTTSAGNAAGGYTGTVSATNNQIWDGSSWSEGSDLNQSRYFGGASGISTLGLVFGGYKTQSPASQIANTESWDGTSFTEQADLSTARYVGAPAHNSTSSDALYAGGNPGNQSATEEWTAPSTFTKINLGQVYYNSGSNAFKVTKTVYGTGSWASGGAMSTARAQVAGAGSQGAGIVVGGSGPPPGSQNAELYNGSAWTETGNLSGIARRLQMGTGGGSQSSAISVGGYSAPPQPQGTLDLVEKWDGSSWSEVAEINTARCQGMGGGASNQSSLIAGGETASGITAKTEVWNNSSWTESGDVSAAVTQNAGGGPVTSAFSIAGRAPSTVATTQTFNGTSWSASGDLNTARDAVMAMVSNDTAATAAGGTSPGSPNTGKTETWDGSSWTEVADMASGRYNGTGVGVFSEGFAAGGGTSATGTTTTEEWTVPAAATNTTITVS